VSSGPVRDFDLHPDENDLFAGVLVRADAARSGPAAGVPPDRVPIGQVPLLSLAART